MARTRMLLLWTLWAMAKPQALTTDLDPTCSSTSFFRDFLNYETYYLSDEDGENSEREATSLMQRAGKDRPTKSSPAVKKAELTTKAAKAKADPAKSKGSKPPSSSARGKKVFLSRLFDALGSLLVGQG